jgi:NAD(P)-dependent dehydrogenase (short-subunit alcohol dehydrogenase family)
MPGVLQAKVAVITGGTSGIGLAIAHRFVREGARIFVTGRDIDRLEAAVKELGPAATGVRSDVSVLADLDALYARVHEEAGRIDVLVANAGIAADATLGAHTEANVDLTLAVNVKGTLFTVQKALPLLSKGASVILTGSTAGSSGTPAFSVYAASKAAVRAFARNWILDLKDRGIRVNTISPGATRTPGLVELAGNDAAAQQGLVDYLAAQIPLGRVGEPDEIAKAAVFLASDDASFVNGAELFVDGGQAQI